MIQVFSKFCCVRVFVINTGPDEILGPERWGPSWASQILPALNRWWVLGVKCSQSTTAGRSRLTESVHNKVITQKSIPAQIRQLVLFYYYGNGFVRELTFVNRLDKHFL